MPQHHQRVPLFFFYQWIKHFLLAVSLQTSISHCAARNDLQESQQQNYLQGNINLSYLPELDLDGDKFSFSHRLLDIVTYTFCTIGILSNFFAYALLNGKATIGILLIKLVLLSDGLVCAFYLLNQIWTDITINYLMNSLVTEYLSRKPILQHISNVLRTLAVTSVSVSNWYIVCMILHRCVSIYANPMRGRFRRSLWSSAQKPSNLWLAYLSCCLFSLLQAALTLHWFPLLLDVLTFVLPLCLVFFFSIVLLYGLRAIQRSQNRNLSTTTTTRSSFPSCCCALLCSPHRCGKGDLDDTFGQTKLQTGTQYNGSTYVANNSYAGAALWAGGPSRELDCKEHDTDHLSNADPEVRAANTNNQDLSELHRKRVYSRITMTILSLAVSFLILDSLQFADLLIRIPWQNILGSVEDRRRQQNLSSLNPNLTMDLLMREVQSSGEKQSVLSIVKNSCTLGKTLTNFLILCAHSRHFRFLLIAHFRRLQQRMLQNRKYRLCCQRATQADRHLYRAVVQPPPPPPAFAQQPKCVTCNNKKKRVRWHDHRGQHQPTPQEPQTVLNRCHCLRALKVVQQVGPTQTAGWPFVSHQPPPSFGARFLRALNGGFSRRNATGGTSVASKTSSSLSRCEFCRRSRGQQGDLLPWRTQWKRRAKGRRSAKQPLTWQQGMIFFKPPPMLPTGGPLEESLLGSGGGGGGGRGGEARGGGSQLSSSASKSNSGQKQSFASSSSEKTSDGTKCLSSTSGNTSSGVCPCLSESSNSVPCCAACLYPSASISSSQKAKKQHAFGSVS